MEISGKSFLYGGIRLAVARWFFDGNGKMKIIYFFDFFFARKRFCGYGYFHIRNICYLQYSTKKPILWLFVGIDREYIDMLHYI